MNGHRDELMTDITPPPELVDEWRRAPEYTDGLRKLTMVTITVERLQYIATQAARWGADQELDACWAVVRPVYGKLKADWLRSVRRPKPPSLKEQSLALIDLIQGNKKAWDISDLDVVRRALEQLND